MAFTLAVLELRCRGRVRTHCPFPPRAEADGQERGSQCWGAGSAEIPFPGRGRRGRLASKEAEVLLGAFASMVDPHEGIWESQVFLCLS